MDKKNENWQKYQQAMSGHAPRSEILDFVAFIKQKEGQSATNLTVLDVGRNVGNEAVYFAQQGFNVTAIHLNPHTVASVTEIFGKYPNITLKQNDDDASYNVVSSTYCLPFFNQPVFDAFWAELVNSIKPEGYFVGNFFGNEDGWAQVYPQAMTFLTVEQIKTMFDPATSQFQGFVRQSEDKTGLQEKKEQDSLAAGGAKFWHIFSVIAQKKKALDKPADKLLPSSELGDDQTSSQRQLS